MNPQVDDVLKIRCITNLEAQMGFNVLHYLVTSIVNAGLSLQELADELFPTLSDMWADVMADNAQFRAVGVQRLDPVTPPTIEFYSADAPINGVAGEEATAPQVAGLIYRRALLSSRANRSYTYLPFPADDSISPWGRPSVAYTANAETIRDFLLQDVPVVAGANTTVLRPIIFHRATFSWSFPVSAIVRPAFSQQKRRSFIRRSDVLVPA